MTHYDITVDDDIAMDVHCELTVSNDIAKPGQQYTVFSGSMCALSIANSTLLNWPIVSLLILFNFILFSISNVF